MVSFEFVRRFRWFLSIVLLSLVLLPKPFFVPIVFAESNEIVIESVEIYPTPEGATIEILSDKPISFVTYTLTEPDRLVIDPVEGNIVSPLPQERSLGGVFVRNWKFEPSGDYLSFELTGPSEHLIQSVEGKLSIRIRHKQTGEASVPEGPAHLQADLLPPLEGPDNFLTPPAVNWSLKLDPAPNPELPTTGNIWSLEKALEFGLSRHRPVQISEQEEKLAAMKVKEARRALYPVVTLRTSWTTGTASRVNFREASTGVQLEQPLYYSGRLSDTYRQALVNLQITEKRQNKVKSDFVLEVAQAYFQMVGAQAALEGQSRLIKEVEEIVDQTRVRFDKGLLTRLELLNVEAQVNQIQFQKATAENDAVLARLKFMQRMKLDPNALVEVPAQFQSYSPGPAIDMEEALQLSIQYRPDIQINNLLVQFNEFEVQIAKEKGNLKVDLSGFIGVSGSAFETETLSLKRDYQLGLKASKNWGPNSATLSGTQTKTAPQLGQSSRTASNVYSGEFGILNQLQGLSEIQQGIVALERAKQDLDEAKASVFQEVEEAYIAYSKARLQLDYAKQKIAFREEQLKIFKAQASINEALPSQILEALIRLSDEEVGQTQALTNYYVALARLNKAVGLPSHYS